MVALGTRSWRCRRWNYGCGSELARQRTTGSGLPTGARRSQPNQTADSRDPDCAGRAHGNTGGPPCYRSRPSATCGNTTDSTYTEPQPFHQFSLSPSEATLLLIHARAARATYTWVLELDYITNGKEYHRVINASDGRPFMTSPATHNPLYRWFAVNKPYGWHRCTS